MSNPAVLRLGVGMAVAVAALDQFSKWWILDHVMQPPRVIPVTPFFNLVLGWNRGVSFGIFDGDSPYNAWILTLVALIIVAALAVWLVRSEGRWVPIALGMVIGGALGNVIDRLRFGAVADFLDVHVMGYHWPAFNAADTGITIGAIMLVIDTLFTRPDQPNKL